MLIFLPFGTVGPVRRCYRGEMHYSFVQSTGLHTCLTSVWLPALLQKDFHRSQSPLLGSMQTKPRFSLLRKPLGRRLKTGGSPAAKKTCPISVKPLGRKKSSSKISKMSKSLQTSPFAGVPRIHSKRQLSAKWCDYPQDSSQFEVDGLIGMLLKREAPPLSGAYD